MRSIGLLVIAILFLCGTAYAERTVWYVHPDSALNTIQAGLDSCADNDIVLVGPGTYVENIVWPNTQGIHLVSELGPEMTIIDGDDAGSVISIQTAVDTTTIINGFTLENGSAGFGGGIFCDSTCSPIISYNTITNNTAWDFFGGGYGGGIFCEGPSQAIILNNTISNNSALASMEDGDGGGIFCIYSYSGIIIGNTITGNYAQYYDVQHAGGGIACWGSSPVINSCVISDNDGDGVYCVPDWLGNPSNPVISYNDICDNIGFGVCNADTTIIVSADSNWWGDATGPYHPTANPGGLGDTVSDYVDFIPWLYWPGVEEQPIVKAVETHESLTATIFRGPLQLPEGKKCKVFDITGRVVAPDKMKPGIYFLEIDNKIVQKVVKVR